MDIPQIQSQLAFNRRAITRLHSRIVVLKDYINNYTDFPEEERDYVKAIQHTSKEIARLVVLQKALKKDISQQIKAERLYRDAVKSFFNTSCSSDLNCHKERNNDATNTELS